MILSACNPEIKYRAVINGKIINAAESRITLYEVLVDGTKKVAVSDIDRNGNFNLKLWTKRPRFYRLVAGGLQIDLIINTGDKIKLQLNADNPVESLKIRGSDESDNLRALAYQQYLTNKRTDSLNQAYTITDSLLADSVYWEQLNKINNDFRRQTIAYVISNTNKLSTIAALYQQYPDGDLVLNRVKDIQLHKIVTDSLMKYFPYSAHAIAVRDNKNVMVKNYQLLRLNEMSKKSEPGSYVPDIELPSIIGDITKLSGLKGKYTLVVFWKTTSEKSLQHNHELKPVYEKYKHKGFEIYQVLLDANREAWTANINFEQLHWVHVIENSRYPVYSMVYNIKSVPSNYLIDPSQTKVLGKDLSASKLDVLLKERLD